MRVFMDGATGYLGRAVLAAFLEAGHEVMAQVRSRPERLAIAGVTAVVGEVSDRKWLLAQLESVDGAVHTASPNDATSGDFDIEVLKAVVAAFTGTGRRYVHTGGSWIHGSGRDITEQTPPAPPAMVSWRPQVVDRVRAAAADGISTSVVAPANLYGHGGGLPALIINGPVVDGALCYPGSDQHFANVHVEDAADLFVLAFEQAPPGSYFLAANADAVPMHELARAASELRGLGGQIRPETEEATRARLGPLTDPLLLDEQIDARLARSLGWSPTRSGLLDELRHGSYQPPRSGQSTS